MALSHQVLQGQSYLVPLGCLHIQPLQWNFSHHWNQFQDPQSTEDPVLEVLWLDQVVARPGPISRLSSDIHLFFPSPSIDFCPMGWGALLD